MTVGLLEDVTKRFGRVAALDRVTLEVAPGEVLALLGANGAGKTTALALLLGLKRPDGGRARLFGLDPRRAEARRQVGVALQENAFPATLRVRELLGLVRAHYAAPRRLSELAGRFGLERLLERQLGGLSVGQRRLVAVAVAFTGGARLVVLDEPTAGLDAEARHAVWDAVRAQAGTRGTVLLTTHYLEEAEALATRVVLLDAGAVVADGSVAAIKAAAGLTRVSFRAPAHAAVPEAQRIGERLVLLTDDAGAAVAQLVLDGVPLAELEVRALSLEDAIAIRRRAP